MLHRVVITADSVRGVPFQLPLKCIDCQVVFARAGIDSLRLGDQEATGAAMLVGVLGVIVLLAALAASISANYP